MTVTIELKPEIEKRLAEKAKQNGLPIETFIEIFIEDNLEEETETATKEKEKSFHKTATKKNGRLSFIGGWIAIRIKIIPFCLTKYIVGKIFTKEI